MRAWRTHEYGPPLDVLQLDDGRRSRARGGRGAGAGAGDPAQPQRPRAHHRRQHDGAARAAVQPGHGGHGRRRRVRRRRRGVAGPARSWRCRRGRTAATPSTRSARPSRRSRCPTTIPLPDAAALYFPFHLAWLGLFDRAELQAGETRADPRRAPAARARAAVQLAKHAARGSSRPRAPTTKVALCRELGADVAINYNDDDFAEVVLRRDRQPRRRRRVRQRRRGGDGGVDEVHRLQRSLPDDGLRLEQGRWPTSRSSCRAGSRSGTSSSAACCSRTRSPTMADAREDRRWAGTSPPASWARRSCATIVDLVVHGSRSGRSSARWSRSKTSPDAIDAMANRSHDRPHDREGRVARLIGAVPGRRRRR